MIDDMNDEIDDDDRGERQGSEAWGLILPLTIELFTIYPINYDR